MDAWQENAGREFAIWPLAFRAVHGRTDRPGDMRLDFRAPVAFDWTAVPMDIFGMGADFHGHNEQRGYPYGRGSEFHFDYLRRCYRDGWWKADRDA